MKAMRDMKAAVLVPLALLLAACGSSIPRPEPEPLPADPKLIKVHEVWRAEIRSVTFPLVVQEAGPGRHLVALADNFGHVRLLDARTGETLWSVDLGVRITAGVGHDGRTVAVVTADNDLVALQADDSKEKTGKVLWRQRLPASSHTPPLVAGERVFVLGADRSVSAYDGASGRRLWTQSRSGEPLVLRVPGVLMPVGDTLVVNFGARLAGLNPMNGTSRWELTLASPRGTNDVERLADLVGGVSRQGSSLCLRSFQQAVGCINVVQSVNERADLLWTQKASGASGLAGDDRALYGVEFDGTVQAWRRGDGERLWSYQALRFRKLTSPLLLGGPAGLVVFGDSEGRLHFLAREDGALQARHETGLSPIAATPVLAGNTLVVVTASGWVLGLRPE